jgi:DNA modification methylase
LKYKLLHGDSEKVLAKMDDNSVDSIVTDPPYGLSFMGKKWDYDVPSVALWRQVFRVLKPGGHLLSFAGSRTYHRMAVNIEDAGFEIRDQIMWIYGSGFPKSMNIAKAIDKRNGYEGDVIGTRKVDIGIQSGSLHVGRGSERVIQDVRALSPEAKKWDGWGSALKPAHEPIVVARKPLENTIVDSVLRYGTGAINIDGCRVRTDDILTSGGNLASHSADERTGQALGMFQEGTENTFVQNIKGRFPANVIHDGSDEVVSGFPVTKSGSIKEGTNQGFGNANAEVYGKSKGVTNSVLGSEGSASRFFYCAKASKQERNKGFDIELTPNERPPGEAFGETHQYGLTENSTQNNGNNHPTVKPVDLMKYLCRLVTPPNGIVLDPFMGSGTTGIAATVEGFNFIGVEMSEEYLKIADTRISHWVDEKEELIIEERKQKSIFEAW